MKAWRVEAHGHPREVMHLRDVPVPEPGPGQVAIKASAVALNLPDTRLCFGTYAMKPQLPFTPGFDVAGRIIAVGVDVDPTLVGTRGDRGGRAARRCAGRGRAGASWRALRPS